MSDYKFTECSICAVRPGAVALCESCLVNRGLIEGLQEQVDALRLLLSKSQRYVGDANEQINLLTAENKELRRLNLKRFVSCLAAGMYDEETKTFTACKFNWECSLCGAMSMSLDETCNLVHTLDCPLREAC